MLKNKRFFKLNNLFKCYKKNQIFLCILISFEILLNASVPFLIKTLIEYITLNKSITDIFRICLFIILVTLINVSISSTQNYFWHKLRLKSINYLRLKMFESAMHKSKKFFLKNTIGEILAQVIDDVNIVAQNISIGVPMLFSNVLTLIVVVTVLLILNYKLALICLIIIPMYYLIFNYLNKFIRETSKMERENYGKIMRSAQEKLLGIQTIKIFKKQEYMISKFQNVLDEHFKYIKKNLFFTSCGNGANNLILSLLPVIILIYGSFLIKQKQLTLGTLIAFYTYMSEVYSPINNLIDYQMGFQTAMGMSDRVLDFLEDNIELEDGTYEINSIDNIEFKNVSFSYGNEITVLNNLNFNIKKGDKVAIIGDSGSGKSTILNLIMKFFILNDGEILINGINIMNIKKESLYDNITLLEQDPFVFEGTIEENITLGNKIEKPIIDNCIKISKIGNLIESNKENLNYKISEFGSNISGGQKQRLCLCRNLCKNSQLILLDEATSSLDYELEKDILIKIDEFVTSSNKTLIAITHRPSILTICNKVIHIKNGKIIDCKEI